MENLLNNIKIDNNEELSEIVESNKEINNETEGNDDGENLFIDKNSREIYSEKQDPDVDTLYNRYKRGKLILRPKYQRNIVINYPKASKIIESILLDVPLPNFYLAEENDGKQSVIDGQQRLTSIFSFIDGKFPEAKKDFKLSGLKVMTELNGKGYKDIDSELQDKILNTTLRVIIILKKSNPDIKFEIFERLNTGSTPLNEDELRNTVYRGEFMDLLAELENDPTFNKLVDKPNFKNRMIYRGMILRFLAFYEKTYLKYKTNVKQFCNNFIEEKRNLTEDKKKEYIDVFKNAVSLCFSIFGENSFRRYIKNSNDECYSWANTRINMALYDIEMYGFTLYKKEQYYTHSEEIREAMIELMMNNSEFVESIQIQTSNKDMVAKRFKIWSEKLEEIMKNEKADPRFFSYKIKEELYNKSPFCGICGNKILSIDDSHVDHIKPYSKSADTSKENGQITHRWCNLHKNNN